MDICIQCEITAEPHAIHRIRMSPFSEWRDLKIPSQHSSCLVAFFAVLALHFIEMYPNVECETWGCT